MKTTKQFLILAVLFFTVISCAKKKNAPLQVNKECKLNEIVYSYEDGTPSKKETFNYDDKSRIIKVNYFDGTRNYQSTITYNLTEIVYSSYDNQVVKYQLDASNRVISDSEGFAYTYNNDGYLIRKSTSNSDFTKVITYTYENQNLVKTEEKVTLNSGFETKTLNTYEYGSEVANKQYVNFLFFGIGYQLIQREIMKSFFGKSSKNLPIKQIRSDDTSTFTYIKDTTGKITGVKINIIGSEKVNLQYNYMCL